MSNGPAQGLFGLRAIMRSGPRCRRQQNVRRNAYRFGDRKKGFQRRIHGPALHGLIVA